jgi:ubiquinone/menaquinone biosynthesis C-methylase UbiE
VFVEADPRDIPAENGQFSLVVSGPALAHVAELPAAISELGRVLRAGGHLIASVLHRFKRSCVCTLLWRTSVAKAA